MNESVRTDGPKGALRRSALPLLVLNLISVAAGGVAFLFAGDFQTTFFLALLAESGFILISAGLEDIRMTPSGTEIRRAIFRRGAPYSPERHKEALKSANFMIMVGGILFAETVALSLAAAIL